MHTSDLNCKGHYSTCTLATVTTSMELLGVEHVQKTVINADELQDRSVPRIPNAFQACLALTKNVLALILLDSSVRLRKGLKRLCCEKSKRM